MNLKIFKNYINIMKLMLNLNKSRSFMKVINFKIVYEFNECYEFH
jgi:hypothetical protein